MFAEHKETMTISWLYHPEAGSGQVMTNKKQ
jgi:hypothetical protein